MQAHCIWFGVVLVALPATALARQSSPEAASEQGEAATSPEDRTGSFRPVEGGGEVQSGEVLLVEAYAAIWILAFALIFLSFRRQKKLDAQIARLREDLARVRDGGE